MTDINILHGQLAPSDQRVLEQGFVRHSEQQTAPAYTKERINWLIRNDQQLLIAALTANLLWDWLYVDELWVDECYRGQGFGKRLMLSAEKYAKESRLVGIWLWTQSWQAADFYQRLGFQEFTRFENFPRGYTRIGFRKNLT